MFMTTVFPEFACDAGIMVTASHLPYNRNGFKFFTAEGGLNKGDIAQILEYAADEEACRAKLGEPGNTMPGSEISASWSTRWLRAM